MLAAGALVSAGLTMYINSTKRNADEIILTLICVYFNVVYSCVALLNPWRECVPAQLERGAALSPHALLNPVVSPWREGGAARRRGRSAVTRSCGMPCARREEPGLGRVPFMRFSLSKPPASILPAAPAGVQEAPAQRVISARVPHAKQTQPEYPPACCDREFLMHEQ